MITDLMHECASLSSGGRFFWCPVLELVNARVSYKMFAEDNDASKKHFY